MNLRFARFALIVLALAAGACTRKTTLVQDSPDSTATGVADSTEMMFREIPQAWDSGTDDAAAASLTARAVFADLRPRDPATWRGRAEDLLDSLGVGVESAGGACGLIVNLFVRSDPSRGSWPVYYWCDGATPRYQEIEGRGMRLLDMARKPAAVDSAGTQMAALFTRARGGRQDPFLYTWSRGPKDAKWKVGQTLGPDSLGGSGAGRFDPPADSTVDLVTRTYRPSRGWDECVTCPHVYQTHRFRWGSGGFTRIEDKDEPSIYATLVRFLEELASGAPDIDRRVTAPSVIETARRLEMDHPKGTWRIAPATEDSRAELTVFRGARESYRVSFAPDGSEWRIASITEIVRSVE